MMILSGCKSSIQRTPNKLHFLHQLKLTPPCKLETIGATSIHRHPDKHVKLVNHLSANNRHLQHAKTDSKPIEVYEEIELA